ncbi:MAG: sensor histidine kinase [Burkholderiaceae bacterium]
MADFSALLGLDTSAIIAGKVRLDKRFVDLQEALDTVIASMKPALEGKSIALEKEIAADVPAVECDPERIQQILWNLLSNAVKFTGKGGHIDIVIEKIDDRVRIVFIDNGVGIDADFLPKLFERFSQADASSRRSHGGPGLGLFIAKNLVELHGGSLTAASAGKGQGARFALTLPIHSPSAAASLLRAHPRSAIPKAPAGSPHWPRSGLK